MSPAEWFAAAATVAGFAVSALALAFKLGNIAKESEARDAAIAKEAEARSAAILAALEDLSRRHNENSKETRDKLASVEGRTSGLENFRAGTDVKLDNILQDIAGLQVTLNERLPRQPARRAKGK